MSKEYPSKKKLCDRFNYCQTTGRLLYKTSIGKGTTNGVAGYVGQHGYRLIKFDNVRYLEHRLIWIWHNGSIQTGLEIDHIDRNKLNNRIDNLRLATRQQNATNSIYSRGASGCRGVTFNSKRQEWYVRMMIDGRRVFIGNFKELSDAIDANNAAKIKHGNEFTPEVI